jgi:hypothetical protein
MGLSETHLGGQIPTALEASRTLLALLEVLRPALTAPSFTNLVVLFAGWVLTAGPHVVTEALVATGVAGRRHHEAFHRFFSRGTWSPDDLGRLLFARLERHRGESPVRVVIDDTLAPKKGPHVFGLGTHLDAVRSTRKHKTFSFGRVWVVLALVTCRRIAFSFDQQSSIGFRSGEYGGRNSGSAPAASINARADFRWWAPRLSSTTTSPGSSTGTKWSRTKASHTSPVVPPTLVIIAATPSPVSAPIIVSTVPRFRGTWATRRFPLGAPP